MSDKPSAIHIANELTGDIARLFVCWRANKPDGFTYEFFVQETGWPLRNIVADADTMQQRMVQGRDLLGRKQPKITPKRAEDGLREGCRDFRRGNQVAPEARSLSDRPAQRPADCPS
jgi:hypothetical protein